MTSQTFQPVSAQSGPMVEDRHRVYLLPGELHASSEPCQITTILGSCVAICLWDARRRTGGMNHFLLPESRESSGLSMRFGDVATQELLQRLADLGCQRKNLRAKLFGGAALHQRENRYAKSLGARNVEAAQHMMKSYGIEVVAQNTGGGRGQKVVFNTDDGVAWVRWI